MTTGIQHWPEINPEHKEIQAFDVNTKASLGMHMYDLWPCIIVIFSALKSLQLGIAVRVDFAVHASSSHSMKAEQ